MNTWEAAYSALEDLSDYKENALGLFALGLRFGLDDLSSIGVDAVTDGSDDKKLDIVFINSEEEYAVVGQCYYSEKEKKCPIKQSKRFKYRCGLATPERY